MRRSYEVSTGSGSDRVAPSLSSCLMCWDPVATAPGTDLIRRLTCKSHFNRQASPQRRQHPKRSARRGCQIVQGNRRRPPFANHSADDTHFVFLSLVLIAQLSPGFAAILPGTGTAKIVNHE